MFLVCWQGYWFIIVIMCVFSKHKLLSLHEGGAETLHRVGVLTKYYYYYYYYYIFRVSCMDNKLYKMHCTYIKILIFI